MWPTLLLSFIFKSKVQELLPVKTKLPSPLPTRHKLVQISLQESVLIFGPYFCRLLHISSFIVTPLNMTKKNMILTWNACFCRSIWRTKKFPQIKELLHFMISYNIPLLSTASLPCLPVCATTIKRFFCGKIWFTWSTKFLYDKKYTSR